MFYVRLFAQQKCQNKDVDLRNFMKNYNLPQLNKRDVEKLEGKLILTEISEVLRRMKSEKSLAIHGFPADFLDKT